MHSSPDQSLTAHTHLQPQVRTAWGHNSTSMSSRISQFPVHFRAPGPHTAQINICFSSHVPANWLPAVCLSLHAPPSNNFFFLPIGQFSPSLTEKQKSKRNKVSTSVMKTSSQQKESKLTTAQRETAAWNQTSWDTRAGTSLRTSCCRKTFKHSSHTKTLERNQLHNTRSQVAKLPLLVKQFVSDSFYPLLPLKQPFPR